MMARSSTLRVALALILTALPMVNGQSEATARPQRSAQEMAIAACIRHASLGKGWLEKTLWGLRDQEAGWIGAEVRNTNGSHDLGPLQINSWWVPRIAAMISQPERSVRYWLRYDPCFGAEAARWIFLSALQSTGDYWAAVGIYHSPTSWRQRRYSSAVADHMARRFGRGIFAQSR
jgi:hypothetical protein